MVHAGGGVHVCVHLEHVVEVPDRSGPAGAQVKQIKRLFFLVIVNKKNRLLLSESVALVPVRHPLLCFQFVHLIQVVVHLESCAQQNQAPAHNRKDDIC